MKPAHDYAAIFPLMQGADFDAFVADIGKHGLREPIVMYEEQILDGRNRARACEALGIEPNYITYKGDNPFAFVLSLNLRRRHLNESQRAMVAARIATLGQGGDQSSRSGHTQSEAAEMLNVSVPSIKRARVVIDSGSDELVLAVDNAEIPVSQGSQIASQSDEFHIDVIDYIRAGDRPMEAIRKVKGFLIADQDLAAPTGKYRIIYADPPWQYATQILSGAAQDHYPTMLTSDIAKLPINVLAEDDAVLFMWATSPLLPEGLEVVKAWGFKYKAMFVWDKVTHNMGHYNSVRHELLLVCTKGSYSPQEHVSIDSVYSEKKTTHSKKPDYFYDVINSLYPEGARIELFARRPRDGWDSWGYEADKDGPKADKDKDSSEVK